MANTPEMKLIVPQYVEVTSSYSHKFVPENYGIEGHRFAPFDFFQALKENIAVEEATPERRVKVANKLHDMCKDIVEARLATLLKELRGDVPQPISASDMEGIADLIKLIAEGVDLVEVSAKINEAKATRNLNDAQLEFLRNLVREKSIK